MTQKKMFPAISLLVSFGVYLLTMGNTVSFFDSGELIAASATLGLAHPPGYPLYVLVGHIFSYIPISNIAFRTNLASAVFGALAVMVIYMVTETVLRKIFTEEESHLKMRITALSASFAFAFSLNHWGQTNMSEVYALNSFMIGIIILILINWRITLVSEKPGARKNRTKHLWFAVFLFGLGFGDHHTVLVVVPVAVFIIAVTNWRLLIDLRFMSLLLFFFILGFSVYLYLPIRASQSLIMNWGDPETLEQFLWLILRQGYPKGEIWREWSLFFQQLKTINLLYEFTVAGFILFTLGLVTSLKKGWSYAGITGIVLLVLSVGVVIHSNAPKENIFLYEAFHTPTYMVFAPWIGVGMFWLLSNANNQLTRIFPDRNLIALWLTILTILPAFLIYEHYDKNDRSRNFISYDYATNELKSLSSNGILFTWGDSGAFPLWYLQYVERYQPGVLLLHTPHLASDWYIDEIPDLKNNRLRKVPQNHRTPGMAVELIAKENLGKRRSYIDYSSKYSFPIRNMNFAPYGIVYRHEERKESLDPSIWDNYVKRDLVGGDILKDLDIGKAISIYGFCYYDNGYALLKEGRRNEAINMFKKSVEIVPGLKARAQRALFPRKGRK